MRLLVLVLNILVGSSLLAQPTEILAASIDTKAHKNNHARGKNKHPRALTVKQKKSQNPGDVWERIRSGMQIPRPSPVQNPPDQALEKNNSLARAFNYPDTDWPSTRHRYFLKYSYQYNVTYSAKARPERILALQKMRQPINASAPIYNNSNYTPYGRLKMYAATSSRLHKNFALQNRLISSNNGKLQDITAEQARLRTRIDFHPKLQRLDYSSTTEPLFTRNSPLAKPVKTNRSGKPVLTPYGTNLTGQGLADQIPRSTKEAIKFERVNKHIVWYTQHRDYLHQVAERARPYLYHIVDNLSKHKLPHELALLPIVESAYQPTAQSPKSAAGLWQFIPSTGLDYDLHQSDQYDARLDISASTQAAAVICHS